MREESSYVTNESWQRGPSRPDAIDDIADQFERPTGPTQFWSQAGADRRVVNMRAWSARRAVAEGTTEVDRDVAHG